MIVEGNSLREAIQDPSLHVSAFDEGGLIIPSLSLKPSQNSRADSFQALLREKRFPEKFLNTEQFLQISQELGVNFHYETLNQETFKQFENATSNAPSWLVGRALSIVAHGLIQLDAGSLPCLDCDTGRSPTSLFVSAVCFLCRYIEERAESREIDRAVGLSFLGVSITEYWKKALAEAFAAEEIYIDELVNQSGNPNAAKEIGQLSNHWIEVYDLNHTVVGQTPVLTLSSSTYGNDVSFRNRIVPGLGRNPTALSALVNEKLYPYKRFLYDSPVSSFFTVLPVLPGRLEALFKVLPGGSIVRQGWYKYEVITEKNYSKPVVSNPDLDSTIGIRSEVADGKQEYFSARPFSEVCNIPSRNCAEVGNDAAESIIIILTPVLERSHAEFLRAVMEYKLSNGLRSLQTMVDARPHYSSRTVPMDMYEGLVRNEWLTEDEARIVKESRESDGIHLWYSCNSHSSARSNERFASTEPYVTGSSLLETGTTFGKMDFHISANPMMHREFIKIYTRGVKV